MSKKKYLPFDAINFSFKMLSERSYFFFKLFSAASLLLCGIILLVFYVKRGYITQADIKAITITLNSCMTGEHAGTIKLLEELELTNFMVLFIYSFVPIYLLFCDMLALVSSLSLYDNKSIALKKTISQLKIFPRYVTAASLSFLAAAIGYRLFIIPGLLMETRLRLSKYFIADKNIGVIQSLKNSWNISKGHMLDVFMVYIMGRSIIVIGNMISNGLCELLAIDIVSVVIRCYTAFVCLFISVCAHTFLYRNLLEEKQSKTISLINENPNQIATPIQENI